MAKADWHVPSNAAPAPGGDPFAPVVGAPAGEDPFEGLRRLIHEEAELDIACGRKDEDWAHPSCLSCGVRGTPGLADLCRIGVAQETLLGRLDASAHTH